MTHDPLCPQAYLTRDDYERVQVTKDGCQTDWDCRCPLIARVREDERMARKDGFALTDIRNAGFRDGYVLALSESRIAADDYIKCEVDYPKCCDYCLGRSDAVEAIHRLQGDEMNTTFNCHYCGKPTARGGAHTDCIPINGIPTTTVNNSITVPVHIRVSIEMPDGTVSHEVDAEFVEAFRVLAEAALKMAREGGRGR